MARFPAQLEDVTAGTRAALAHLEQEGVSTHRVVVVGYACGADFYRRALALGIPARLYLPETGKDSHSDYVVGCFLEKREDCGTLDAVFRWLEEIK